MHHNYTYAAFGTLERSTDEIENNYLFTGEQFNKDLESYYLRARSYDSSIGSFTSSDRWSGSLTEPTSLHKYQYGDRNPIRNTDPSGNITLSDVAGVSILSSILIGILPGAITNSFSRDVNTGSGSSPNDDVIVYVGFGIINPFDWSASYPIGHVVIEVDNRIYSFPSDPDTLINPGVLGIHHADSYLSNQQSHYLYEFHRYSMNYDAGEKQELESNLRNNLTNLYASAGMYSLGGVPWESVANNCTTFVTDSLPGKGRLFNALVKSQWVPYGLGWALDQMDITSRGSTVKKLTTLSRPI
jgi:RHS repeat-associated protein